MQVVFVGGASGVGASCIALEIANQWIVVDAGVRVDRKSDPLPDLALLEGKDVRAIFVTHAHADHIGALPLVHQAYPSVPIFASRATGLLMEVMLADALKIMDRRAAEEMEIPLYPPDLVGSMLNQVRPLPVGEALALPQLPGVTVHASRAGHIAGAVSFCFTSADGRIVVSGDLSITPQHTVLGAVAPPVENCDLLVLESTYGARLHPNREAECQRLAQSVGEVIAGGGHCLMPCFGLGRGQEILLVLRAAQEKGQIPEFPIYIDGLVRRVCSTYLLLPEALPPVLQRQIRRGYLPFSGPNITFVRDERERERILAGPPACILSSSGMLTGGPSVWYAQRLAGFKHAAICCSGYADEEAPMRGLLDVAEGKNETLQLGGKTVLVRCRVEKFNLSAHADGSELAAYAASVKPRQVALVHGDEEARRALALLLHKCDVLLPTNGETITPSLKKSGKKHSNEAQPLPVLPSGIGQGRSLTLETLPELWQSVSQIPSLRIVTARELAFIWYGKSDERTSREVLEVLESEHKQRYFVHQQALQEAYRVRGQGAETPEDTLADLVGRILLVEVAPGSTKPVLCLGIETGGRVRVLHAQGSEGKGIRRSRYPFSAIVEVLGSPPADVHMNRSGTETLLEELIKSARLIWRRLSAHQLAHQCQDTATYSLDDLCALAGVSALNLTERLAVAKLAYKNPLIFVQQRTPLDHEGTALYGLAPDWDEALETPEELARPDQQKIQTLIEKHLGEASDLYRRSIDPETGAVTLFFYFPVVARGRYASQITLIAAEAGVTVHIASQPHQGELIRIARQVLPSNVCEQGFPSVYHERQLVQVRCVGFVPLEEIAAAQRLFTEQTGWQLNILLVSEVEVISHPDLSSKPRTRLDQHSAVFVAQQILAGLPDYIKVGATGRGTLRVRFQFSEIARLRYAEHFARIEAQTGWAVQLQEIVHQEALADAARRAVPFGLSLAETPSLYHHLHAVRLQCKGSVPQEEIEAAQQRFAAETGWQLTIAIPGMGSEDGHDSRMAQGEAMAFITEAFSTVAELYRIGVDARLKIFWLHFHFPEKAKERYAELLIRLEQETGWEIALHPHVHQKALLDLAQRLLPGDVRYMGKKSLYPETHTLRLTCAPLPDEQERQAIALCFKQETGWALQLDLAG